jgi:2-dehydro-3-deoxygluconokinase
MRVASIGECMIEIAVKPGGDAQLASGGDTLNTAVYLARQGVAVDYVTALGDDPYSDEMLARWQAEGVGTELVPRLPGRVPGLYMIRTDDKGERTFHYWRDRAPAREIFELPGAADLAGTLAGYGLLYFSGITLSLYSDRGRDAFHAALSAAKAKGARIAFDGNYRPRGWPDKAQAQAVFARFLALASHALPTFDDEHALFGDADPQATIARLRGYGVGEIVVKSGGEGCHIATAEGTVSVPVPKVVTPVDTTAAGDSFNAGYLAGRFAGLDPAASALRGHRLAAAVIGHRGAVVPRQAMPDFAGGSAT